MNAIVQIMRFWFERLFLQWCTKHWRNKGCRGGGKFQ